MKVGDIHYRSIWFENDQVRIIDQRWLPHDFRIATLETLDDFATAIYSQLLSLQESREPVEVVTSRRRYSSMLIEKISVENNKDTSGAVFATVALREVIVAQTRSTSLPPYAHQQEKDKTAEKQSLGTKSSRPAAPPKGGSLHWN